MRLIGKLLALPFMLVTGILYLVCKFLVVLSGAVLGILSGIIFLAALTWRSRNQSFIISMRSFLRRSRRPASLRPSLNQRA